MATARQATAKQTTHENPTDPFRIYLNLFTDIYYHAKKNDVVYMVTNLADQGIDVYAMKKGKIHTPVSYLAFEGDHKAVECLLSLGASIDYAVYGYSLAGNQAKVEELKKRGAKLGAIQNNLSKEFKEVFQFIYENQNHSNKISAYLDSHVPSFKKHAEVASGALKIGYWPKVSYRINCIEGLALIGDHQSLIVKEIGEIDELAMLKRLRILPDFTQRAYEAYFQAGYFANPVSTLRLLTNHSVDILRDTLIKKIKQKAHLNFDIEPLAKEAKRLNDMKRNLGLTQLEMLLHSSIPLDISLETRTQLYNSFEFKKLRHELVLQLESCRKPGQKLFHSIDERAINLASRCQKARNHKEINEILEVASNESRREESPFTLIIYKFQNEFTVLRNNPLCCV